MESSKFSKIISEKPYIEIIQGNCTMPMKELKGRVYDMVFVDPPFFEWGLDQKGVNKPDHNMLSWQVTKWLSTKGTVFLCGTQPQLTEDWAYWRRMFRFEFEVIQSKIGGTPPPNSRSLYRTHENIWCLTPSKTPVAELKLDVHRVCKKGKEVTAKKPAARMGIRYGEEWKKWRTGVDYPKSVQTHSQIKAGNKEYWHHPTQKPLRLIELLMKISTDEDDWILDPFAGSGTTLVAAQRHNRNCVGIEINPEYAKTIIRRLESQRKMEKLTQFT